MMSNKENNIEATFKFYTKNKERLAIFYVHDRKEVVAFKCSKKDVFKKRIAWKALAEYLHGKESDHHPIVEKVEFGEKYLQNFMIYCRNKYYVKLEGYQPLYLYYNPNMG